MSIDPRFVRIVVFVPASHADAVREAMGAAGAGKWKNYAFASFSVKGTGRFLPLPGAKPAIGQVGKLAEVEEERIEVACERELVSDVVAAIKKVHPYEEPAIDVYPVETYEENSKEG